MTGQHLNSSDRHLIFELGYGGHYPSYIGYLCDYWRSQKRLGTLSKVAGQLFVVVSPQFAQKHKNVIESATSKINGNGDGDYGDRSDAIAPDLEPTIEPNIKFVSITEQEANQLTPRTSPLTRAKRALQEWNLVGQYAQSLNVNHCLLLYLDSFQTAIALHKNLPCPFSGIYFRPTFHYRHFANHVASRKEKIQFWREKFILPRVLNHWQLHTLFCLDPFAVKPISHLTGTTKAIYLPDPVPLLTHSQTEIDQFKQKIGIEPDRTSFLLFGALYDRRKGLTQVLEALLQFAPQIQKQICLVLIGQIFRQEQADLDQHLTQLEQGSSVQLVINDRFVSNKEMKLYFASADIILATYQKHVGMSGIVVEAAAAERPLICSSYGLMGQIVSQHQLGITVDATKPIEIAQGVEKCLSTPIDKLGDRTQMQAYAAQNSTEQFASNIFNHLSANL